jgi:hypothetical protein
MEIKQAVRHCRHKCKDKAACAHVCCSRGVAEWVVEPALKVARVDALRTVLTGDGAGLLSFPHAVWRTAIFPWLPFFDVMAVSRTCRYLHDVGQTFMDEYSRVFFKNAAADAYMYVLFSLAVKESRRPHWPALGFDKLYSANPEHVMERVVAKWGPSPSLALRNDQTINGARRKHCNSALQRRIALRCQVNVILTEEGDLPGLLCAHLRSVVLLLPNALIPEAIARCNSR